MWRLHLLAVTVIGSMTSLTVAIQPPGPPQPAAKAAIVPQPVAKPGVVQKEKGPEAPLAKDDSTTGPKRIVPQGPPEFEIKFIDDSLLKVIAIDSTIQMSTKYGNLTIPLADVLRIEFGFRFPEGLETKVEQAVLNLGASAFRDRETAEKDLFTMAEYAVPALRRASKHPDPEIARRAEGLLKKLAEKLPEEKMSLKDFDLVEMTEGTVRGRVESVALKVKNRVIGETALKLKDLRMLRSTAAVADEFSIDAGVYGKPNDPTWYDSGIDITSEQPFQLTASGTVDLAPNQGGGFVSTPIGNAARGTGGYITTPQGQSFQFAPGALVGRIGQTGAPFVVGTNFKTGRPANSGRLYLKIAPSPYGLASNGSYKIKVKMGG